MNPLDLTDRRFLVTGASSGIGRATAVLVSQLGGRVIVSGRNEEQLAKTLSQLAGEGHASAAFDLSRTADIPAWMKCLAQAHGSLHGLVHSAGVVLGRPLQVLSLEDIVKINSINVDAAIMLAKGFRQKGVCAAPGSIVYISSVAALKAQPSLAAYAAGKGALISLTRTLAAELARQKIRVNCVCPGLVETPMAEGTRAVLPEEAYRRIQESYPLGFGTPLDVAYAIGFLLADTARWITGASLVVDGGYSA